MPRIANETNALLKDLQTRLERLVAVAKQEGHEQALADVRALVSGSGSRKGKTTRKKTTKRSAKKTTKRKKKRKNPWATMTPKQKAERVRKMLAGRGLKPKSER